MSINRVNITGNLTRDCEVSTTAGGTNIVKFGVAVNDRRKGRDGKYEDHPNYIDCFMYMTDGQLAWQQKRLHKGAKVAIDGSLRWSSWETKDGQRRSKVEVLAREVEFMVAEKTERPRQDDDLDDIPWEWE